MYKMERVVKVPKPRVNVHLRMRVETSRWTDKNRVWFVGASLQHIMRVGLYLAILLSVLRWPLNLRPLCVAGGQPTPQTTSLTVEYTLIIANSPDCELSLVDNFPVRVQYRTIMTGGDGGRNNSVSQWMDSPRMPGTYMYLHIKLISIVYKQELLTRLVVRLC